MLRMARCVPTWTEDPVVFGAGGRGPPTLLFAGLLRAARNYTCTLYTTAYECRCEICLIYSVVRDDTCSPDTPWLILVHSVISPLSLVLPNLFHLCPLLVRSARTISIEQMWQNLRCTPSAQSRLCLGA